MSQAIMGQNELEKLLQRVLNEVQYKKVKEYLDKEPTHLMANQGSQIDFVITTAANNMPQQPHGKRMTTNKIQQQSFKNLRHNNFAAKPLDGKDHQDNEPLNIQAKSLLNPSAHLLAKQESQGFLSKIAQQTKQQPTPVAGAANTSAGAQNPARHGNQARTSTADGPGVQLHDQFFIDSVKDLILKTQINDWRSRHEASEALFDLIRANIDKFKCKGFEMLELADALCKLFNDSNAKIQLSALENLNQLMESVLPFVETHI